MMERSEFDHRPDPEIRKTLRAVLSASDNPAFVRRVAERAAQLSIGAGPEDWADVLSAWVKPGLAAAVALTAAAMIWLAGSIRHSGNGFVIDDALLTTGAGVVPAPFLETTEPPDADDVLQMVVENQ